MIKIIELTAFVISAAAFSYGSARLFKEGTPKFFQLFVCAAGCYMIEELWVIVNSLFGNGSHDGLITVRLFGFFGCLCFMLSANANEFDKVIDDGNNRTAKALSFIAPAVLLAFYAFYVFAAANDLTIFRNILGLISLSPAFPASRYSFKHLLLPDDAMSFLKNIKGIDITALVFYAANCIYPLAYLYLSKIAMGVYDIFLAVILFTIVLLCEKGAKKWKMSL